jgi:hypothetical protein
MTGTHIFDKHICLLLESTVIQKCLIRHVSNISNPTKKKIMTIKFNFSSRLQHAAMQQVLSESDNICHKCPKHTKMSGPLFSFVEYYILIIISQNKLYCDNIKIQMVYYMGMGLGSGMVPLHPLLHSFWELKLYTVA